MCTQSRFSGFRPCCCAKCGAELPAVLWLSCNLGPARPSIGRSAAGRNKRAGGNVTGVLEGIRVLDFGRYIAGPYCAALLGDMGAEVIRIEKREGSEDRTLVPV